MEQFKEFYSVYLYTIKVCNVIRLVDKDYEYSFKPEHMKIDFNNHFYDLVHHCFTFCFSVDKKIIKFEELDCDIQAFYLSLYDKCYDLMKAHEKQNKRDFTVESKNYDFDLCPFPTVLSVTLKS